MKKISLMLFALAALAFVGCEPNGGEDEITRKHRTATFEDRTQTSTDSDRPGEVIGSAFWAKLIDEPQYGGPLLYGGEGYSWYDVDTDLYSALPDAWDDHTFYGGGIAVSNYVGSMAIYNTYESQLAVGNRSTSSSKNFLVCYVANNDYPPFIEFRYGTGIFEEIDVCATCYGLYVAANGNGFCPPIGADGYLKVIVTGYDEYGAETGRLERDIFKGNSRLSSWEKWNLSSLGLVKRITFRMEEGKIVNGEYVKSTLEYMQYPTYIAIDNIDVYR